LRRQGAQVLPGRRLAGIQPVSVVPVVEDIAAGVLQSHALHVRAGGNGVQEAAHPGDGVVTAFRHLRQSRRRVLRRAHGAGRGASGSKVDVSGAVFQRDGSSVIGGSRHHRGSQPGIFPARLGQRRGGSREGSQSLRLLRLLNGNLYVLWGHFLFRGGRLRLPWQLQ
ncbi:CarD-like/TRCF domain, partial [Dysosmobacter welbionis]